MRKKTTRRLRGAETLFNDPSVDPEVRAAQEELDAAEAALEAAQDDETWDELLDLVGDLVGYNDARDCLTKGDLMACLWTVVGLSPWGKGAKLVKNTPKIIKLWNRWRKTKKVREAAEGRVDNARTARNNIAKKCETNSFTTDTLVLMADGSLREISSIEIGDFVMSTEEETGETKAQRVSSVIQGFGEKDLVDIRVFPSQESNEPSPGTITATDGHPFWDPATEEWVPAGQITPGTTLINPEGGSTGIANTRGYTATEPVFNLSVEGFHTYYVAPSHSIPPLLVHNQNRPKGSPGCGDIWMDDNRINHHFEHAADFGVTGKWNKANRASYMNALENFLKKPDNLKRDGTFRGQPAVHYIDERTGQHISVAADGPEVGKILGAWKSDPVKDADQLRYLIEDGVL